MAFCTERAISRRPVHVEFYRTVLVVCFAGCLFQYARSIAVATFLWSQPHGWRYRRGSLGAVVQGARARRDALGFGGRGRSRPGRRSVLLSSHGENFRGCSLANPMTD